MKCGNILCIHYNNECCTLDMARLSSVGNCECFVSILSDSATLNEWYRKVRREISVKSNQNTDQADGKANKNYDKNNKK